MADRTARRVFKQGDHGIWYLAKGSIRDADFEIVAQRETYDEVYALAQTPEILMSGDHHIILFERALSGFISRSPMR